MKRAWHVVGSLVVMLMAPSLGGAQIRHDSVAAAVEREAAATGLQPSTSPALTLEQCIAAAHAANARPKAAAEAVATAEARLGQARSGRFPELSAKLVATRFDEDPNFIFPASAIQVPASVMQTPPMVMTLPANVFGPGFPPVAVQLPVPGSTIPIPAQTFPVPEQNVRLMDKTLYSGSLNAVYALYTGGLVGARMAQAKAGIEAAKQDERQAKAELTFDVIRAYYGVLLAQKLRATASDTHERLKVTLDLTESLYKTGTGRVKKTDFLRHTAMVNTVAAMVAGIEAEEKTARAALAMLIGWDKPGEPQVADAEFPDVPGLTSGAQWLADALEKNPQIGLVTAGLAASKAEVRAVRAGHLPKVGLFADLRLLGNSYEAGAVTPENKRMWAVGVGVDVPLFQGFRVQKAVAAAESARRQLEHQQAALRDGVAFEVRRTLLAFDKGQAQIEAAGQAYRAASENRDLHIRAYQDELVETKDMIESQLMEALLAGQFFKAQYDRAEARARLDQLVGKTGTDR